MTRKLKHKAARQASSQEEAGRAIFVNWMQRPCWLIAASMASRPLLFAALLPKSRHALYGNSHGCKVVQLLCTSKHAAAPFCSGWLLRWQSCRRSLWPDDNVAIAGLPIGLPMWLQMIVMALVGVGTGSFRSRLVALVHSAAPTCQTGASTPQPALSGRWAQQ